ncbi:MAG: bifunctional pyr operon transcriptional regulator/uracil phosphoribosyltransferase PyrR [Spirochaetota bacterium]|nr:bifunctional pyr operon transcriptional regulator/uracil phosphoribosyltransferase PyrR [Spirochaetota bacterium]
MEDRVILEAMDIEKIMRENSERIMEEVIDIDQFAIIGIQTRGVDLANRIKGNIEKLTKKSIKSGVLDITFYRDDLATRGVLPIIKETKIEFNISKLTILLVDDVIFTGRTIKAALETLTSFGRPKAIKLFELIDRGNRELPIQPDYCGFKIDTEVKDNIKVVLRETDGVEDIVLLSKKY